MLLELRIANLALAEDVVLRLDRGLTVLTGETGAGKSLVAGSLSLLTGGKSDRGLIRRGEDLAWVEAVCDLSDRPDLLAEVRRAGILLGSDGILVLRRELRREGRGRVLINGGTSSLAILEQVGSLLLSVQSQDEQRELAAPGYARDLLDAALDLQGERDAVHQALSDFRQKQDDLARRMQEVDLATQQVEMWRYQCDELTAARLRLGEEDELLEAIAVKQHAHSLQSAAAGARDLLDGGQAPTRQSLGAALAALSPHTERSQRLESAHDQLMTAADLVAEAATELSRFLDSFQVDPRGLDELQERKALYEDLRRKYRRDVEELLALAEELTSRLERQGKSDQDLLQLQADCEEARNRLEQACLELHQARCTGAPRVAAEAETTIRPLALPQLDLVFSVKPASDDEGPITMEGQRCRATATGADEVRLMARTNPGEELGDVGVIASGGETSRIHLGLTVLRQRGRRPLLRLFDEVDAGLGMDAATPVANLLAGLARQEQALCITHLPTVAVHGQDHWQVIKVVDAGRTTVRLLRLEGEDRVQELARQLGGEGWRQGDDAAQLDYARQLLATVRRGHHSS